MKSWSAVLLPALLVLGGVWSVSAQEGKKEVRPAPQPGQISETELGEILSAIGLKPTQTEQRYDFAFKTSYRGEEWKFSMSAVLSRNGESVWVMAWLDQIPQTSTEVPRTALLRLLAANDRLGEGKFFAYIPTNKRFVMQRVIANRDMNNKKMMEILQDLASSVADEYPTWSVTNWAPKADQAASEGVASDRAVPTNPTAASRSPAPGKVRSSDTAGKFDARSVN
ncbi:MAG: hypothetical protein WCK86_08725 [Planctomycetia bacterium]